jgi:hypothetical protein
MDEGILLEGGIWAQFFLKCSLVIHGGAAGRAGNGKRDQPVAVGADA